jgi:DNA-directed RNA polymerase specialized sigma subunit
MAMKRKYTYSTKRALRDQGQAKSDRNRKVVELVDSGLTRAQVAQMLGITHQRVSQIYNKEKKA